MLTQIWAIAATALPITQCFTETAVAFSAPSLSEEFDKGFSIGAWVPLSTENYSIAASCDAQEWSIDQDKASVLWLHFSSIDLASGAQLLVSAPDGSAVQSLESQASDVTTTCISGSEVTVKFVPPSEECNSSTSSIVLDAVGYEYVENLHEIVCGANDTMKNVVCFASGSHVQKIMASKAKAVMRIQQQQDGYTMGCTAWLWGNQGHIITNSHCISSQEMVDATEFQFDVQTRECNDSCTVYTCPIGESLTGKDNVVFIQADAALDYAVMRITTDATYFVSVYGYLQIRASAPVLGEEIYIPQHPLAGPKKIATMDNDGDSKIATIRITDHQLAPNNNVTAHFIGYVADTDHGSSGSPVLSREDDTVVGLHRMGGCDNLVTRSDQLATILRGIVSGNDGYVD